jgi:hypothetical protein
MRREESPEHAKQQNERRSLRLNSAHRFADSAT